MVSILKEYNIYASSDEEFNVLIPKVEDVYKSGRESGGGGNYDEGYEAGQRAEYDRFWDNYQNNGNRTDYERAFAGTGWTDELFNPKYKIVVGTSAYMTFAASRISEITPEKVDFSETKTFQYTFYYSNRIKKIEIDCSSATTMSNTFYGGYMEDIKLFNIPETLKWENAFKGNSTGFSIVTNFSISGIIGKNGFDIQYLTNVSKQNLIDILNCLKDYSEDTSGTAWVVTLGPTNLAKLSDTEKAIATQKGWTLA